MTNQFRRPLSFGSDRRNQNIVTSNEQRTGPIYRAPSPDNLNYRFKGKIGMINPIVITSHLKANYRFMHIGLVQVEIKPLLKTGVNAPIYLAVRDKRLRLY